jgi:hypothetical protein
MSKAINIFLSLKPAFKIRTALNDKIVLSYNDIKNNDTLTGKSI